jgi:DNA polymerase-3 subunit gamma/tau
VAPLQTSELPQIWQQVIAHLHPLSKALLNDYGRLLAFDGHQARIGITSEKLVKIAQNQLKNVEKAFETLYGQVVKVSLEVTKEGPGGPSSQPGAGTHATSGMGPQPSPGNGAAGSPLTNNHSPSPSDSPMGAIGVVDKPKPSQKSQKAAPVQPESVPSAIAASVETADDSSGNSGWPQDDELTTAAKRLADFFGGKVVDLTDDLSALAPTAAGGTTGSPYSQEVASSEPLVETEDEDNDDDVPF